MEVQKSRSMLMDLPTQGSHPHFVVTKRGGAHEPFVEQKLRTSLERLAHDNVRNIDIELIIKEVVRTTFDGISTADLEKASVMAACSFIEKDPAYGVLAARLLRQRLAREVFGSSFTQETYADVYRKAFVKGIRLQVAQGLLDERMLMFNLEELSYKIDVSRDDLVGFMGTFTLYERYLLKQNGVRLETLQAFWMRIAMGLALLEENPDACAMEFYDTLSNLRYVPSTPTLFHSGFPRAQLSSCYLNTVNDDLSEIFKVLGDNAQLSKWAGGIGTDWTNVRGTGAWINSIRATSQGVVPYLKLANDVVVAITRSGIRRGGTCAYLEVWHYDIEDFLDLRRNTGDERRRTHDMNTANWIPDLFMERVAQDKMWTLFSPEETKDLHHIYGQEFKKRYEEYEAMAREGKIKLFREISALALWRKMLTRLFETGHPWITFKDACNIRSPQDHVGVVHSSNLCTEITLNTSATETAVCNLGSINLERHVFVTGLDTELLERTVKTAIRMLDNVVDLNFYPTKEAENSNKLHRPIGLGLMGFQDALYKLNIPFSDERARDFADESMERISYYAISASCDLAQEKGAYSTYKGSKWDRGIFPLDTIDFLERERGMKIQVSRSSTMDWASLKARVAQYGMRNSNTMAIAPTATIATIAGCYPCIEPIYKNIYVKSNVSGEFTIVNTYLVEDLKKIGLWDQDMLDQIKYYDGDISRIQSIPEHIRQKYQTAFELDAEWLIEVTAARGKWIDQSQSHNVFLRGASGKKLHDVYIKAWNCGLKTTYYLRTLGATQVEKSTLDTRYGFTQKRTYDNVLPQENQPLRKECSIENPECESCQ